MKLLGSKRMISVLTVFCMVAALIVPMGMATASAASTNLVSETSFNVSDWGSKSVALTESLEANTTYKWSFKFSVAGGSQSATVTIGGIEVFSGSGFNSNTVKSGEFTTGDTAPTDATVLFKSNGGGWYGVSDVVVEKVVVLKPEDVTNYAATTSFTVDDWGSATGELVLPLEANTTYKWSFKFSTAGGSQTATVTIAGIQVFSGTGFYTNNVKSGEFTTGDTAPTNATVLFKSNGGGWYAVSDLVIEKVVVLNPDEIENYATKTSYTVGDWGQDSSEILQKLTPNTTYVWKFKLTEAGGSQNITLSIAGNQVFAGTGYQDNIKNGVFTIGETAPESVQILFKSGGGGQYKVAELVITKLFVGDVNCDTGVADNSDMLTLKKIVLGTENALNENSADLNADGKIDLMDLIRIKRYLANEDVELGA